MKHRSSTVGCASSPGSSRAHVSPKTRPCTRRRQDAEIAAEIRGPNAVAVDHTCDENLRHRVLRLNQDVDYGNLRVHSWDQHTLRQYRTDHSQHVGRSRSCYRAGGQTGPSSTRARCHRRLDYTEDLTLQSESVAPHWTDHRTDRRTDHPARMWTQKPATVDTLL
eukprot:2621087-Rhodomonas_salina.1